MSSLTMNWLLKLLFFAFCAVSWAEEKGGDWKKYIRQLKPEEFEETVKEANYALVFFYAPWCSHCQKAMPELKKTQQEIEKNDDFKKVLIAAVDCTEYEDFCIDEQDMEGYPTFKVYRKGVFLKHYLGNPDDDFLSVLEQAKDMKPPPPPIDIESEEEPEKVEKSEEKSEEKKEKSQEKKKKSEEKKEKSEDKKETDKKDSKKKDSKKKKESTDDTKKEKTEKKKKSDESKDSKKKKKKDKKKDEL